MRRGSAETSVPQQNMTAAGAVWRRRPAATHQPGRSGGLLLLLALVTIVWVMARPARSHVRGIAPMHIWAAGAVYTVAVVDRALVDQGRGASRCAAL